MAKTIGSLAMSLISQGMTNNAILEEIQRQFPRGADGNGFKTTPQCVSWYRAKMRRDAKAGKGQMPPAQREAAPKGRWVFVAEGEDQLELPLE